MKEDYATARENATGVAYDRYGNARPFNVLDEDEMMTCAEDMYKLDISRPRECLEKLDTAKERYADAAIRACSCRSVRYDADRVQTSHDGYDAVADAACEMADAEDAVRYWQTEYDLAAMCLIQDCDRNEFLLPEQREAILRYYLRNVGYGTVGEEMNLTKTQARYLIYGNLQYDVLGQSFTGMFRDIIAVNDVNDNETKGEDYYEV